MRHRNKRSRLSMMTAHRNAMLRNMVQNLFKYERIETTLARAKETRRLAERILTMCKEDTVASRRRVYAYIPDRDMVKKLFTEIAPMFKSRNSGFTRIIHTDFRRGDGATLALIELTERKIVEKLPKKKKEKAEGVKHEAGKEAKSTRQEKVASAVKHSADVKDAATEKTAEEVQKEIKKEATKIKSIPKGKPSLEDEKRVEKAKSEDKRMSGQRSFMKNIRGIFRKRGDR